MIDPNYLCAGCMRIKESVDGCCPYCGFDEEKYLETANARVLRPGTILAGKYMVGKVLGEGGFGITYIGWDLNLELRIAIKEYFPVALATRDMRNDDKALFSIVTGDKRRYYESGLESFAREAKNLAKFQTIPGIVSVKDFFYENQTAYLVMEYVEGMNLKQYLSTGEKKYFSEEEALKIMRPVMDALVLVHKTGIIHRDISPENIIMSFDGTVKLIDFGSARMATGAETQSLTVLLKHGYAPVEQYQTTGKQGPWTDVYALCATLYRLISGRTPEPSIDRMLEDTVENLYEISLNNSEVHVSKRVSEIIEKGLQVRIENRYHGVGELRDELYQAVLQESSMSSQLMSEIQTEYLEDDNAELIDVKQPEKQVEQESARGYAIAWIFSLMVTCVIIVAFFLWVGEMERHENQKEETGNYIETLDIDEDVEISEDIYQDNTELVSIDNVIETLESNDRSLVFDIPTVTEDDAWQQFSDREKNIFLFVNNENQCGDSISWIDYPYLSIYGITCGMPKDEVEVILDSDRYEHVQDNTDSDYMTYVPKEHGEIYYVGIRYQDSHAESIYVSKW